MEFLYILLAGYRFFAQHYRKPATCHVPVVCRVLFLWRDTSNLVSVRGGASMMNAVISLASFFLRMTGVPAEVALVVIDALPTRSTELRVPSCLSRCPAGLCSIILCSCSYISTMTWSLLLLLLHRSFSDSSSNMIVQA